MTTSLWKAKDLPRLKQALSHVLWIGGATDAGKTTSAKLLADQYGLEVYLGDFRKTPMNEITPEHRPAFSQFLNMTVDERWVTISVERMVEIQVAVSIEKIQVIVNELLEMPPKPIVVEWFGLLPDLIVPLQQNPQQSVWLFPSAEFKRESYERRGKPQYHLDTSDPQLAWQNHLQRDLRFGNLIRKQAESHGLSCIVNDGSRSQRQMMTLISEHFHPFYQIDYPHDLNNSQELGMII